ncbi:hypothetical protein QYE76_061929 [Lolium multiflorum]|uniref:Uncharacterized protein n=1 Tax=Lolium multiflorum TaxID=4521 RepID=A0AAD8S2K2_LOLMU|nr:hypothetical protein QYE76_061929 [Lolium multiflorum]
MDETEKAMPAARRADTASTTPTTVSPASTASSCSSNPDPDPAAARTPPPTFAVPWARADGGGGYYPGCRKDANCACEICLASINATRDLLPPEAASARRCFAAAARDTRPGSRPLFRARGGSEVTEPWTPPPQLRSTAKSRRPWQAAREGEAATPKKGGGSSSPPDWAIYALTVLGFLLLLWVDTGLVPEAAARGFGPKLAPEAVARVGLEARLAPDGLGHKLRSVERGVGQLVGAGRIHNCSSKDSVWRLEQNDQHVFHWRCAVYKSAAEEVTVWGSPLRTSGLLPSTLSSRHITLLSGQITEWSDGKVWPTVRASNGTSWSYRRRSAGAVQLEPETWVLEYQRSVLFEGTRLLPATVELLASRCSTVAKRARRKLAKKRSFYGGAGGIQANPT